MLLLEFNGRFVTVAVAGDAGDKDNGTERRLHGSLRDVPYRPRRLQLGDDLHSPQTPRLFRFRLATLVHVVLTHHTPSPCSTNRTLSIINSIIIIISVIQLLNLKNVAGSVFINDYLRVLEPEWGKCTWLGAPRCYAYSSSFTILPFSTLAYTNLSTICSFFTKTIFSSLRLFHL